MKQNPHLTKEQREVLFEKATEHPGTGKLLHNKEEGTYHCANCGELLFTSKEKYDSGSGWPSFFDKAKDTITYHEDNSLGMKRIEVCCKKCGGHLGHMFDDGPKETGKRYCINSASLEFKKK